MCLRNVGPATSTVRFSHVEGPTHLTSWRLFTISATVPDRGTAATCTALLASCGGYPVPVHAKDRPNVPLAEPSAFILGELTSETEAAVFPCLGVAVSFCLQNLGWTGVYMTASVQHVMLTRRGASVPADGMPGQLGLRPCAVALHWWKGCSILVASD